MNTCDNKDRLLELLYGLLDESETSQLRVHLQTCAQCQAALREAEGHKRLISQAARVCDNVPPFVPADFSRSATEPASLAETLSEQSSPTLSHPLLPGPGPTPQGKPSRPARRAPWKRLLVLAGVAASLLLAVVLGLGYHTGFSEREGQFAEAKKKLADLDGEFVTARANFQERQKTVPAQLANQSWHMEMSASNNFDSQAPLSLNFYTTDLIGNPRDSKVKVEVTDETLKKVLRTEEVVSEKGKASVEMPAGLARKSAKVRVTAQAEQGPPAVADLRPAEPVYLMHLATNKSLYNTKDKLLFFRTVTVEDYSLKPIATPIALRYSLKDLDGKTIMELEGETDPGGIAGGEFPLTDNIPSGTYFLEVAAKTGNSIVPQRHQLEILQETTPRVAFDKIAYIPGEDVNFSVKNSLNSFASPFMISQQRVQGNDLERVLLNERGQSNFRLRKDVNTAQVVVQDNATNSELQFPVPVVPAQLDVGLYPEGGQLVEGLKSNVFFTVLSPEGEPVAPKGIVVIVRLGSKVLYESKPGQGQGVFPWTPNKKEREKCTIVITSPSFEIARPFEKLSVQPQGVVLNVPRGVVHANEPIEAHLNCTGDTKRLLVLLTCRGQVVEQRPLLAGAGPTVVQLKPDTSASGVMRLAVYEVKPPKLVPVAERLVFRMPAQRLELAATTQTGSLNGLAPGQKVQLKIQGQDEKRQPVKFWALVTVSDDKNGSDRGQDLPSHFLLARDPRHPDDLEQAQISVNDDKQSLETLDLFLGTQGWRRPASQVDEAPMVARNSPAPAVATNTDRIGPERNTLPAAKPTILSVENASPASLQAEYEARVTQALKDLRTEFVSRQSGLAQQKKELELEYQRLFSALAEYELAPRVYLRFALAGVCLLGLAAGALSLVVGLVQLAFRRSAAPALVGSFVAFGLCMVLYLGVQHLNEDTAVPQPPPLNTVPWPSIPDVSNVPSTPSNGRDNASILPPGNYQLPAPVQLASDNRSPGNVKDAKVNDKNADVEKMLANKKITAVRNSIARGFNQSLFNQKPGMLNQTIPDSKNTNPEFQNTPNNFSNGQIYDQELQKRFEQARIEQENRPQQVGKASAPRAYAQSPYQAPDTNVAANVKVTSKDDKQFWNNFPNAPSVPNGPTASPMPGVYPSIPQPVSPNPGGTADSPTQSPREAPGAGKALNPSPPSSIPLPKMKSESPRATVPNFPAEEKSRKLAMEEIATQHFVQQIGMGGNTILWFPALFSEKGFVELTFDLPFQPGEYRLIIQAHTAEGRLGYFEDVLKVGPAPIAR